MALDDAAGKKVFVGRDKEINDILNRLKQNNSTRTLLVDESGVGKSALLDETYVHKYILSLVFPNLLGDSHLFLPY
jgi:ATP-dependent Clp protease ATP-binding subunit ClpA